METPAPTPAMPDSCQSTPLTEPPRSIEPEQAPSTDVQWGLKMSVMRAKLPKHSFEKQRREDHASVGAAIQRHLGKQIPRESKFATTMPKDDRWAKMLLWWEEATREREEAGNGSTRLTFKDDHDQQTEEKWLKKRFARYLEKDTYVPHIPDADPDDEDSQTPNLGGVKTERQDTPQTPTISQSVKQAAKRKRWPSYQESEDESENEVEADDEEAEDPNSRQKKKAKWSESEGCNRGLGLIVGGVPTQNAGDAQDMEGEGTIDEPAHQDPQQAVDSRWTWIEGELRM